MTAAMAIPGNGVSTFLVYDFGGGLDGDDGFVVERLRALACGDIRPVQPETANAKGWRKTKRIVISRKEAEAMRPDITEIIVFTRLRTRGGRQAWGSVATDLFRDRKQRG